MLKSKQESIKIVSHCNSIFKQNGLLMHWKPIIIDFTF